MYVSTLRLRNWRNFTKAEMDLGETMYIIGPNASGKSNLLDVFRFMRDIANPKGGGLQQALLSRGGLKKVRCLAARKTPQVELDFEFRENLDDLETPPDWRYILSFYNETAGKKRPIIEREEVYCHGVLLLKRPDNDDLEDRERLTQTYLEQTNMNKGFRDIVSFFEDVLYLHLVPQLLKFSDELSLRHLESDPFGQGFLEELAKTPPKSRNSKLDRIREYLEKVIPNFQKIQFIKDETTGRPHLEMLYKHWRPSAGWQREDQFSDGTLRLIALLWTLLSSNSMILLEEPELSLNNGIVEQIPSIMLKARQSRKKAGGQVLVSTHSEAMLSGNNIAGDFLILKPSKGGEATCIQKPSPMDIESMRCGMTPADILLPQTSASIERVS